MDIENTYGIARSLKTLNDAILKSSMFIAKPEPDTKKFNIIDNAMLNFFLNNTITNHELSFIINNCPNMLSIVNKIISKEINIKG